LGPPGAAFIVFLFSRAGFFSHEVPCLPAFPEGFPPLRYPEYRLLRIRGRRILLFVSFLVLRFFFLPSCCGPLGASFARRLRDGRGCAQLLSFFFLMVFFFFFFYFGTRRSYDPEGVVPAGGLVVSLPPNTLPPPDFFGIFARMLSGRGTRR